jgi:hypothetical protein
MNRKKRNNKKPNETILNRIKSSLKSYSYFLWFIPLFIIVSFTKGIDIGFFLTGIMISGILLGEIISVVLGTIFKKYNLRIIYGEIIIFTISTFLLYLFLPDKKLLLFMIPFCIPSTIIEIRNLINDY